MVGFGRVKLFLRRFKAYCDGSKARTSASCGRLRPRKLVWTVTLAELGCEMTLRMKMDLEKYKAKGKRQDWLGQNK